MAKLVIFGAGPSAKLAHYYFTRDSAHDVVAFAVDQEYRQADTFLDLPLVSFEGACGQMIPPASGRTRIVIFHALGTRVEGGNFGIVSQGFPQLVRVSSDVVRPDNSRVFPDRAPIICQVIMVNETPMVPDLERLEEMIADETRVAN